MLTLKEAIEARHSVRHFEDRPIADDVVAMLEEEIASVNRRSGLHIQLFVNEPEAFAAGKTGYGQFKGCRNYLAMVGPRGCEEEVGYWGEHLVLLAQQLGLNSCWVGLTYKKGKVADDENDGEKRYLVIALGYGVTQGVPRRSKAVEKVSDADAASPRWYRRGIEAALLAPTAINQQKFRFSRKGDVVTLRAGLGPYAKVDRGIAKYHFEVGAAGYHFEWA